ncbi:hypothetical protein C0J52_18456, partial [Blattella germanica]
KNNESPISVQRIFREHFNLGRQSKVPNHRTSVRWLAQFCNNESCHNKKHSGCPKTQRTPKRVQEVQNAVLRSPQRSADRHALALGMSARSLHCTLHTDL